MPLWCLWCLKKNSVVNRESIPLLPLFWHEPQQAVGSGGAKSRDVAAPGLKLANVNGHPMPVR